MAMVVDAVVNERKAAQMWKPGGIGELRDVARVELIEGVGRFEV